jgi:methionine aminotransferase
MQEIRSRLPDVGTSIFAVMSKMALDNNAINLSQGFPDFAIDQKLIALVNKYMLEGHNQYAPMPGLPGLRQAIATALHQTYNCKVDPDTMVTVTAGATEGIYAAISAFVGQGDEVIMFDPSYDSYDPAVRLNGAIPVHINLTFPGYKIDWQLVETKICSRTRMLIINSPHNPTGITLSDHDLRELERLTAKYGILVLSDEVYDRLIFDEQKHRSVLTSQALAERCIAVFSFGKTFHATGWKCGYVVASAALTQEVRKTHQFLVFSVNTPLQWALAEYMTDPEHFRHLHTFYQRKRDLFLEEIDGSSFEPLPCRGSYFQLLSYQKISSKKDVELAELLTKENKVASIPVSVFYQDGTDNHILRFCFAKQDETLRKAGEILRRL